VQQFCKNEKITMKKRIFLTAIIIFLFPGMLLAGGLSSNWGEVIIANLEPGKNYDLNDFLNTRFKITNNFDSNVNLKIEILIPQPEELKPGYEAIEDVSWVKVQENISLEAGRTEIVPIQLKIPEGLKYFGKKYQFWIWSHTSGQAVGVGLKSRIMFSMFTGK